jgi:hypothetical protein
MFAASRTMNSTTENLLDHELDDAVRRPSADDHAEG